MLRSCSHFGSTFAAASGLVFLVGCGAGTAAIIDAASGGSGGGGNASPSISAFRVEEAKESPARIAFLLSDQESNPVEVELFFQLAGAVPQAITKIPGLPSSFETTRDGIEYGLDWNFTGESGIPADGSFTSDITVFATLAGGIQGIVPGANAALIGVGNDAPVVRDIETPNTDEVDGVIPVQLVVEDTSSDVVRVKVEYDIADDDPDTGWQLARPSPLDTTPEFAIESVVGEAGGTDLVFFWDTDADLEGLERDVSLRFTPEDEVATGDSVQSTVFRVDNNAVPIASLDGAAFVVNQDGRRGIPVPFRVSDKEGDEVQLVFQWRRPGEGFPDLPSDPALVNEILLDPALREQHQIASEFPTSVGGRIVPVDPVADPEGRMVRLPELAAEAAIIHATDSGAELLVGRELEILRASPSPVPLSATWSENPLQEPVAALPLGNGSEALVLERPLVGSWQLRVVELATGDVVRVVAAGDSGDPNSMAYEPGEASVLVASDVSGSWRLQRVDLMTGAADLLHVADGSTELGEVRGMAIPVADSVLLTVGSSLVRVDCSAAPPAREVQLLSGLDTPWGLVVDPLRVQRVFVAERDAPGPDGPGRVSVVDLDSLGRRTLQGEFPRPESLALERHGSRLLAVVDEGLLDGLREVRAVELGGLGGVVAYEVASQLDGRVGSVAVGPDGLRLVCLRDEVELLAGGGIEQKRTVDAYDPLHQRVTVDSPFAPALGPGQLWRIRQSSRRVVGSALGKRGSFVWDSQDVLPGSRVFLKLSPVDDDKGASSESGIAKKIAGRFAKEPVPLLTDGEAESVAIADLDGDGDLDFVIAVAGDKGFDPNADTLRIYFQVSPGVFEPAPGGPLGGSNTTDDPVSLAVGDLDGDGDLDLVSANSADGMFSPGGDTLTIFFQTGPGVFELDPSGPLGGPGVTDRPVSVAIADLNGDGALDLVSANAAEGLFVPSGDTLTIFFQTGPGVFELDPSGALGGPGTTDRPVSVATGDLDGDGDIDLVSANAGHSGAKPGGDTLTVFFQTSPGVFELDTLGPLGGPGTVADPMSVVVGDLDGDGDLDLVSTNVADAEFEPAGDSLTIFFQTKPGVFEPDPSGPLGGTGTTEGPVSVAVGDLDGDGDLDLVSANAADAEFEPGGDSLTIFLQTSPGVFEADPGGTLGGPGTTESPVSVAMADVDGNGGLDLVVASRGGVFEEPPPALVIFLQPGPGTFEQDLVGVSSTTEGGTAVAAGDLDADGDLDLISANPTGHLSLFFQTSPAVFEPDPAGPLDGPAIHPASVVASDLDGDGDLDFVSANIGVPGNLMVHFQTSPGVFVTGSEDRYDLPPGSANPQSLAVADLDGDGDLDLVSGNLTSDNLTVFFQTEPGVFDPDPLVIGGPGVTDVPRVVAADLDQDGDTDLASANFNSRDLTIFFQTAPGVFELDPGGPLGGPGTTDGVVDLSAADLDADGDFDLVAVNRSGDNLILFFQTSPGIFELDPNGPLGSTLFGFPDTVTAADLDGDGDIDLLASFGGNLARFTQSRPGIFELAGLLGGPGITDFTGSIVATDLDGDGDPDFVTNNLTIFFGLH